MSTVASDTVVPPGAGTVIDLGPGRRAIKVGPPLSEQVGVIEAELPPRDGFPVPHYHDDLDEVFYVLEGEIEYLLHDTWIPAPAGTTVFIPARTVHAFRNATDRAARQLVIAHPEIIELLNELGQHPRERWRDIHEQHRSHYARDPGAPAAR
jgi:quercetin dioxygenase-like cupin family protein